LEQVIRAQVFSCPETGFSQAILFDYENGAQRAVGHCRIGVDPFVTYTKPSRICSYINDYDLAGEAPFFAVLIESGSESESEHSHDEEGWACHGMRGDLHFWSNNEQSYVEVIERK